MSSKDFETLDNEFGREGLKHVCRTICPSSTKVSLRQIFRTDARLYGWYCLILRNLLYRVGDICKEKTELRKEINQLKKQ
jgi:hypothetical protein